MKSFTLVFTFLLVQLTSFAQTIDEALTFLYRSMPLPDSTDYPRSFWERNVQVALQARSEMGWSVPDCEWWHFVLPLRVNNEDLDDARSVFYELLRERVRGLSMYDAILEVNHWCHEKVTYQPSDSRTSAPLATMNSGIGRCGEESTFCVTALRAVGIPARQVYTPRWAHTDDNHAWVEAWADGQWYFLGACEPEPVLNLGWFNAPASRGMLMHTKVFGAYDGPERVVSRNACYTEIDVTDHYAPTAAFTVHMTDVAGNSVRARVSYRLYNYAEFYPLAWAETDERGYASFRSGKGDLLVWATAEGAYGFQTVSVGRQDTVSIVLNHTLGVTDMTLVPPAERNTIPELSEEQIQENRQRLAQEDSIRNHTKHGNQAVLDAFETGATDKTLAERLVQLLTDKDRRDVTIDVLTDSYLYSGSSLPDILSPRVHNERLRPYKAFLGSVLPRLSLNEWAQWVRDSIRVDDTRNPQHLCMSPVSVWKYRLTDCHSRELFFVAGARALGYPARYDEVNGRTVPALQSEAETAHTGMLCLIPAQESDARSSYYMHFTLSRIDAEGTPHLLEYPEGTTFSSDFASGVTLEQGRYLLTTGTRLADGTVLARSTVFLLEDSAQVELALRHSEEQLQVIGSLNSEELYTAADGSRQSILGTTGRGYYVLGLTRMGHEPSNHALHDIALKQTEWDETGVPMLLLDADANGALVREITENLHLASSDLPLFVIADTFNRIVWCRQGYTIGLGEQLLKAVRTLR